MHSLYENINQVMEMFKVGLDPNNIPILGHLIGGLDGTVEQLRGSWSA